MAQHLGQQRGQRRARLQQAEDVDRARQAFQQPVEPVERQRRHRRLRQRIDQSGQYRLQRRLRRQAAQRGVARLTPRRDPAHRLLRLREPGVRQPLRQPVGVVRQGARPVRRQPVEDRRHPLDMRRQQVEQRRTVRQPVQPRHPVQRLAGGGQRMGLPVVDHLHAMLDRAQQRIGIGQRRRLSGVDPPRRGQCRQRIAGRRRPQRRFAPAVDKLMDLREELHLADAAASALQIETGAERLPLRMMVADAARDIQNLDHRAEIQAAAPDERADRVQETLAQRHVARRSPGADERRPLPCQRLRFVIGDRRIDRDRDRRHLRRRAQPQVDAQHIAVGIAPLQQLQHAPRDPHRGVRHILARAMRQHRGIVDQDRVDIRRIIQLMAALLAQRDRREAARRLAGRALRDGGGDRAVQRTVGEIGQPRRHRRQVQFARQVAQCHLQRQPPPLQPQPPHQWHVGIVPQCLRRRRVARDQPGQERRPAVGARARLFDRAH